MDELRDRIARALTDHRYLYAKKGMGGIREEFCTCGWSTGPKFPAWVDFARHQADAVDATLGLREEMGANPDMTPERYQAELNEWWDARKATRRKEM